MELQHYAGLTLYYAGNVAYVMDDFGEAVWPNWAGIAAHLNGSNSRNY